MAGVMSADACGRIWQNPSRGGSSNYGIGNDGKIGCYVDENDISWCNSNWESNCRAVTIETSNSASGGDWPVSDAAYNSLIKLVADIAKRNGLGKLVKGQNVTWHSMYAATACPGPYLLARIQDIVDKANAINYPPVEKPIWTDENRELVAVNGTKLVNVVTGEVVKTYGAGVIFPVAQSCVYNGKKYYRTLYSKQNNIDNGFLASDLTEYVAEPVQEPEQPQDIIPEEKDITIPDTLPEVEPVENKEQDITIPKSGFNILDIFKIIVDFIKSVFTKKGQ